MLRTALSEPYAFQSIFQSFLLQRSSFLVLKIAGGTYPFSVPLRHLLSSLSASHLDRTRLAKAGSQDSVTFWEKRSRLDPLRKHVSLWTHPCSSLADGEALDGGLLLGEAEGGGIGLLHVLGLLVAVELDVAVGGEVGADATVGTVGSTATGDGTLHDNVVDHAVVNVELGSLSVGSEVDEELADALDGLLGPATLSVLELLGLGVTANATSVPSEGDDLFVLETVVHVCDGSLQLHALGGAGHFVSVLVMCAQVGDPALSRCKNEGKTEGQQTVARECDARGRNE